jgi:hypothetical protein
MNFLRRLKLLEGKVDWCEFYCKKVDEGMNIKHKNTTNQLFESLNVHRVIINDKIDRIEWFNVGHWTITCILGYSAWSNYLDLKTLNKDIERRNA